MPSDRVQAALEEFKAALVDEGLDPDTVEAQTKYILPSDITLGGNYADLQRLGAASLAGNAPADVQGVVMPPQPISEPTYDEETGEAHASIEGMGLTEGSGSVAPENVAGDATTQAADGDNAGGSDREAYEQMTVEELKQEAANRQPPVELTSDMRKADIVAALEEDDR